MGNGTQKFRGKFKQLTSKIKNPMHKEVFEHMLVVNSAIEVSADIDALVEHTGYPRKFIEGVSLRMREAKLWIGRRVDDSEWWDPSIQTGLALFMHARVAKGDVRRVPRDDGSYAYINSETGNVDWEWKPQAAAGVLAARAGPHPPAGSPQSTEEPSAGTPYGGPRQRDHRSRQ